MGALGERFALYRLPKDDPEMQAHAAVAAAGQEPTMRAEASERVVELFARITVTDPALTRAEQDRLVALTTLATQARSAVIRDGRTRDIELIVGAEGPTRLLKILLGVLGGIVSIGGEREAAWRIVTKMALDSIPTVRRLVLDQLAACGPGEAATLQTLADALGYATTTASRRAVEELQAYDLAERQRRLGSGGDLYRLSDRAHDLMRRGVR